MVRGEDLVRLWTKPNVLARLRGMTLADDLLAAIRADGPLDDDELAALLGKRRQHVNQVARRLEAAGRISRLIGPQGKLVNAIERAHDLEAAAVARPVIVTSAVELASLSEPSVGKQGAPIRIRELRDLGFGRHDLEFGEPEAAGRFGLGIRWTTLGDVPNSPGLYAFVGERDGDERVLYVGLTKNLRMVTRGSSPEGGRGGQRYGRPKHSGETRQRINVEVARARGAGYLISHWVKPVTVPADENATSFLRREEEALIRRWRLRTVGWNRR